MSLRSTITIATTAAALAATGVASAADAPVVSQQHRIAGAAPVDIPGTGIQQGEWMGSKAEIVFREVTLEAGQRTKLTLRAPKGTTIRGLATDEGHRIGVSTVGGSYVGRRQVTVRAAISRRADEQTARVFAYVVRR